MTGKNGLRKFRMPAVPALALILLTTCSAQVKSSTDAFIRIDRDIPKAWMRELDNVRFLQEEGMSGSAQFSEAQFRDLAAQLKKQSEEVWIVDCRLESHGLINGIAVCWPGRCTDISAQMRAAGTR
ncbi:MAG: hypothetical protein J6M46_08625 [Lachnospiraceae bacterium]|nr:hypothetical protein [Lachnospiraceae bacterium]